MPIIKSAKKRVKVARKAAVRNHKTKRSLKTALKLLSTSSSSKSLRDAQSSIDKAAKKNVIHKNKAARLKSRAAKKAKANGVKITKATPKAAPKKTTTTVKKAAPKKATAKKK
ncbi:MAG TPA: 30S ribosomal protein S20 [Candidatus Saccharimonadales bacterium]